MTENVVYRLRIVAYLYSVQRENAPTKTGSPTKHPAIREPVSFSR